MRKTVIIFAAAILCGIAGSTSAYGQESQRQRLVKHLYTLAADSLQGRKAGTDDGRRAAEYIKRQWQQMDMMLKPLWDDDYSMPFEQQTPLSSQSNFCNLVAVIEGNDPALKDEYIVVGAHYDHVGVKDGKIYNGADDNASGSACVIEVARQLLAHQKELKRSVIICAFDAEELGLFGSKALVKVLKSRNMIDKVKLMLSVDMVGWYQTNGSLVLQGSGTVKESKSMFAPEKLGVDINVKFKPFENSLFTATDTEPFAEAGVPTLAVTTGLKSPYHKPEDDADLIDYEGLDRITDYITSLTISASRYNGEPSSGRLAAKHRSKTLDIGFALGYNTCGLKYPDATFYGKEYHGFQGGLMFQYKLNNFFSLRAKAMYDYSHCPLPAADDAFGKGFGMEQHSIMVPLMLHMGINIMGSGIYIGFGGYYGRELKGRFYGDVPATNPAYDSNPNQAGWAVDFGLHLGGHWQLDGTWYKQFTNLFDTSAGLPKARKNTYALTLGYFF